MGSCFADDFPKAGFPYLEPASSFSAAAAPAALQSCRWPFEFGALGEPLHVFTKQAAAHIRELLDMADTQESMATALMSGSARAPFMHVGLGNSLADLKKRMRTPVDRRLVDCEWKDPFSRATHPFATLHPSLTCPSSLSSYSKHLLCCPAAGALSL
jgi:hypothetical protein